jgi:mannosyltransferase OCH1-like enzyme
MLIIPKIIHFMWIDFKNELNQNPTIPKKYLKNISHTKLLHPDYEIKIWNGYDCDQLMKKYFPDKYELYWSLQKPIMRCDFARLAILYVQGGIYSDMDRISIKSYNELLSKYSKYDLIIGAVNMFGVNMLNNDIIITGSQNDFILKCINGIKKQNFFIEFFNVFLTAGPLHVQKTNYYYKGPSKNIILVKELNSCSKCECKTNNFSKIVSYTTFDGSWDTNKKGGIFDFIYCNIYKISFYLLIILLLVYLKNLSKQNNFI